MTSKAKWFVCIVETATDEVVKKMGPWSLAKANRVEMGASINLNHERFHTRFHVECGAERETS